MPPSVHTTKLISTLRLLISRLRLLQKKDTASSVAQRRELAHLLSEGREASARIRVENVITTDVGVEAMELVELYCELLLARANVLDQLAFGEKGIEMRKVAARNGASAATGRGRGAEHGQTSTQSPQGRKGLFSWFGGGGQSSTSGNRNTASTSTAAEAEAKGENDDDRGTHNDNPDNTPCYLDPPIDEAAIAIFYAWPRFPHDVRELTMLRTLLAERYGKEIMTLAHDNRADVKVPERLAKGLRVRAPSKELVESYLREIARAYGVDWGVDGGAGEESKLRSPPPSDFLGGDNAGDGDFGNTLSTTGDNDGNGVNVPSTPQRQQQEPNKTSTPPSHLDQGQSPISVSPPGPRTDNLHPQVKLPQTGPVSEETTDTVSGPGNGAADKSPSAGGRGNGIPEVDELTRRFAALRR